MTRFEVDQGRDSRRHGLCVGVDDTVDVHDGWVIPKELANNPVSIPWRSGKSLLDLLMFHRTVKRRRFDLTSSSSLRDVRGASFPEAPHSSMISVRHCFYRGIRWWRQFWSLLIRSRRQLRHTERLLSRNWRHIADRLCRDRWRSTTSKCIKERSTCWTAVWILTRHTLSSSPFKFSK